MGTMDIFKNCTKDFNVKEIVDLSALFETSEPELFKIMGLVTSTKYWRIKRKLIKPAICYPKEYFVSCYVSEKSIIFRNIIFKLVFNNGFATNNWQLLDQTRQLLGSFYLHPRQNIYFVFKIYETKYLLIKKTYMRQLLPSILFSYKFASFNFFYGKML